MGLHKLVRRLFRHAVMRQGDEKRKPSLESLRFLVPLTGLEPVRYRYRGILSPLCLPIPPQRQYNYYTTESLFCQLFLRFLR